MKKTLKLGLIAFLVISALISVGIVTASATETTVDTTTVINSGNLGTQIDYDPSTKTMTFTYVGDTSVNYELQPVTSAGDYSVQNFIDKYRTEVEHIEIGFFKKIALIDVSGTNNGGELFAGMTALKSVHFAKNQILQNGLKGPGFFQGCESLTTIWFGDDSNKIEGCANFTDAWSSDQNYKDRNNFPRDLFNGCASLKKIIYTNNAYEFTILSSTFDGCAKLKEVTIGSNITTIAGDAFTNTGVLVINAEEGSAAASVTLPTLLERIEAFKNAGNTAVNEGYCGASSQSVTGGAYDVIWDTDIKWEIYNVGTKNVPVYTIYFYQDTECGHTPLDPNTVTLTSLSTVLYTEASNKKYISSNNMVTTGYAGQYEGAIYHRWHSEEIPATSISTIIIGDGIQKLTYNRSTFEGMKGVEVIECPKSLASMQGADLNGCFSLTTFYTRGQTPVIGTVNLSNFSSIPIGVNYANTYYAFAGLKSVKQYVFHSNMAFTKTLNECCFYDNESLTSITLPAGTRNNSAGLANIPVSCFTNCYSLKEVTIPATCKTIAANSFTNCTALQKVTILGETVTIAADSTATAAKGRAGATADLSTNTFRNCTALTNIIAPYGSDAWDFACAHGFHTTNSFVSSNQQGRYTVSEDGTHLTVVDTGYDPKTTWRQPNLQEEAMLSFLDDFRSTIKTIDFGFFGKVGFSTTTGRSIFDSMTALEEIKFAANQRIYIAGSYTDTKGKDDNGLFKGCSSLKTLYIGDSTARKENVIDLSRIKIVDDPSQDNSGYILYNMFSGCSSIKEVILPQVPDYKKNNAAIGSRIYANTFEGCTSLEKVTIPAEMDIIDDGAFNDCSALTTIDYLALKSVFTSGAFTADSHTGLIIRCQGYDISNAINAVLLADGISPGSVRAFYKNGMDIVGYQIRDKIIGEVENGLRTIFMFNEEAFDGYTIVEYGTLTATADTWSNYSESWNVDEKSVLDANFNVPSGAKIVKTAIYQNGDYVNKYSKNDNEVLFNVTVVNFKDKAQYTAEVVNCGYEVWKTDDGKYMVYFTREDGVGYETTSLYKITLAMLRNRMITIEIGNNPLYNVLMGCDYTAFTPQEGVYGYYFADPLAASKKIAIYMTDSTESVELTNIGFDLTEKPSISHMVFGKNIKFDLPDIDDYWQEHIDAQLATLPAGKSFIAVTDYHYELDNTRNAGKSADLMKYVSTLAGIDTVINLGDSYTGETTHEDAIEALELAMDKKFYKYFGDTGLYAVGNHDSNITSARGADDDNLYTYKAELLLTDTEIYERTVKNLEGNENVVFNQALIDLINSDEIKNQITALSLNTTAEDVAGATKPVLFGNVDYSAEQMHQFLLDWAKLHYAYYDHENEIVNIVINTGALTITDFHTLSYELWETNAVQYDFINSIFLDVVENYPTYDIVVSGHMFYSSTPIIGTSQSSDLLKMFSAFEGGESVTVSYIGNNDLSKSLFGNVSSKTYDYSEMNYQGEIICVSGHCHFDLATISTTSAVNVEYSDDAALASNSILCLMLNQDNIENNSTSDNSINTQASVLGTITEQCFTIYTITEDNTLVATRIGANSGWLQRTYQLGQKKNESVSYAQGISFASEDSYSSAKKIDAYPKTYEAVITLPEDYSGRAGVIFGNYGSGNPNLNFEISDGGKPRLYLQDAGGTAKSVYPNVDVRMGEPVHIAITIENFDSEAQTGDVKCYINGELKTTDTGAALRADFAVAGIRLGGDHREKNGQYFKGSITYAAAYADARTAEEIAADYASFGGGDPIFCYDLSKAKAGESISDLSGNGYDLEYQYVGFLEEKAAVTDYAYSMAIVGDTQKVSVNNPENFHYIYDYILDNVEEKNIQFVIGLGDITDKDTDAEWELDMAQIQRMDGIVPYSLVRGNHDSKSQFDKYVSYADYSDDIAGAYEEGSMLNTYYTFSVGNIKYMVVCLDYGAEDAVLTWAGEVIAAHPDHNVVVTTHAYLFRDGTTLDAGDVCPPSSSGDTNNDGDDIWDKLIKKHENIVLVLSGHDPCREIIVAQDKGINGNTVTQMLIDGQGVDAEYSSEGGCGLVTMFYFSEDGKTVQVEYYSTILQKYYMYANQFTVELDVISAS